MVAAGLLVTRRERIPRWVCGLVVLAVGAGLSVAADLHGPALLGGLLAGGAACGRRPQAAPRHDRDVPEAA